MSAIAYHTSYICYGCNLFVALAPPRTQKAETDRQKHMMMKDTKGRDKWTKEHDEEGHK